MVTILVPVSHLFSVATAQLGSVVQRHPWMIPKWITPNVFMWKQVVDQVGLRPSLANSQLKISFIPLHPRFLEGQQRSLSITDTERTSLMESLHWFLLLKLSTHLPRLTKQLSDSVTYTHSPVINQSHGNSVFSLLWSRCQWEALILQPHWLQMRMRVEEFS